MTARDVHREDATFIRRSATAWAQEARLRQGTAEALVLLIRAETAATLAMNLEMFGDGDGRVVEVVEEGTEPTAETDTRAVGLDEVGETSP